MTTKELLDEYYWCKVSSEIPTNTIKHQNLERMHEIIKELETSIRREVVEQVETFISKNEGWDSGTAWETMVVSSTELRKLLQGITLK